MGEKRIPQTFLKCMKINPESELPYFQFALYLEVKNSKDAWKYMEKGITLMKKSNSSNSSENIYACS